MTSKPYKHLASDLVKAGIDAFRILKGFCAGGGGGLRWLPMEAVAEVESSSLRNQELGECRMNPPVSRLVRIGQCRAFDFLAKPHEVELGRMRRQADLDVAQALAVSQLRKCHYAELLGSGHRFDVAIAIVAIDDAMKSLLG